MTSLCTHVLRTALAAALVPALAACAGGSATTAGETSPGSGAAASTPATSTPTTSTPATSTPAPSTPAASTPASATPAPATTTPGGPPSRATVTPTGDAPALPLPTLTRPTAPPSTPSDQVKPRRVTGRVQVRPDLGCTQLAGATTTWVLVGQKAEGLRDGAEIEVDGLPAPQLRSPCDGTVLRVRAVRPR